MRIGASYSKDSSEFVVWAPDQNDVSLVLPQRNRIQKMERLDDGYWRLEAEGIKPGTLYRFRLNDKIDRPDPASHFQPEGVFGPSAVVDHSSFAWKDHEWKGVNLRDMIMYELHVGTFSREGTFDGAKSKALELSRIGINAVELMPVSQFSGARNWGYDAVFPFAVQNTYGGPDELKKLVEEFHANGIAVILDVIYNHLGPEGNFLKDYGPYFLFNRKTPWGAAINFDGDFSGHVRNFFLENALSWFKNYHVDGLRLDAVFTIIDSSPKHFLKELSETIEIFSKTVPRKLFLIAENDRVDPKIIQSRKTGGYGLDALWHDNLHHSLHALLTGERNWYYSSFGSLGKVVQALDQSITDQTLTSSKGTSGNSATNIKPSKLVVFSQNHDQVGNRPLGERLITIAGLEAAKLAAGIIILSPFTPLLFMGEEHGENAPFLFFTDYTDEALRKKVQLGRKLELKKNGWKNQPPDPQNAETFLRSKVDWQQRSAENGCRILDYYRKLVSLRKVLCNSNFDKRQVTKFFVFEDQSLLIIQKRFSGSFMVTVANFGKLKGSYQFPCNGKTCLKVLDSADKVWGGPGSALPGTAKLGDRLDISPLSMAVYLNLKGEKND